MQYVADATSAQVQGTDSELAHVFCIADTNKKRLVEIKETIKEVLGE
jgi:hypothetical protein